MAHTVKTNLTPPLFSVKQTSPLAVKVTGTKHTMPLPSKTEEGLRDVAYVDAINLDTGEQGRLLLPAVVERTFDEFGPELIGSCFLLTDGGIDKEKNYRRVIVQLLEDE